MSGKTLAGRPRVCVAVFVCVAAVALLLDQISKLWALSALSGGQSMRVIDGLLSFTLVRNPGASLGLGSNFTWVISILAMVACVVIVVLGLRTTSKAWAATLGCAFAGALGNLVDRVSYADGFLNGKVVDFIDYGWSVGQCCRYFPHHRRRGHCSDDSGERAVFRRSAVGRIRRLRGSVGIGVGSIVCTVRTRIKRTGK